MRAPMADRVAMDDIGAIGVISGSACSGSLFFLSSWLHAVLARTRFRTGGDEAELAQECTVRDLTGTGDIASTLDDGVTLEESSMRGLYSGTSATCLLIVTRPCLDKMWVARSRAVRNLRAAHRWQRRRRGDVLFGMG